MNKLTTFAGILTMLASLNSLADDAKVLSTQESVEINATADAVWNKVSDFGDLGAWHPAVKTTVILDGTNNQVGAVRLLTLQDGGTIKEKLNNYSPADKSFSYEILEGVLPVSNYHSTLTVTPISNTKSKVVWKGDFKRKDTSDKPTKGAGDEDATTTMSAVYKAGLENLKKISE